MEVDPAKDCRRRYTDLESPYPTPSLLPEATESLRRTLESDSPGGTSMMAAGEGVLGLWVACGGEDGAYELIY